MDISTHILQHPFQFNEMRENVLLKLSTQLSDTLKYHSCEHTINVERIAEEIAHQEKLKTQEVDLIRTAALYHDLGFIHQHEHNELLAIKMAETELPAYDYSEEQIQLVCEMIHSTKAGFDVQNIYDKIISDADHDYFGRPDYFEIAERLRIEYSFYGRDFSELEWLDFQLNYLDLNHVYWTDWSKANRTETKKNNIAELKRKKKEIQL
ncbi:MAG: HD domain-containing protein [Flavobacteriales bacterium]|jgi:adenylate cyclase